jgi:hypothetical protein
MLETFYQIKSFFMNKIFNFKFYAELVNRAKMSSVKIKLRLSKIFLKIKN